MPPKARKSAAKACALSPGSRKGNVCARKHGTSATCTSGRHKGPRVEAKVVTTLKEQLKAEKKQVDALKKRVQFLQKKLDEAPVETPPGRRETPFAQAMKHENEGAFWNAASEFSRGVRVGRDTERVQWNAWLQTALDNKPPRWLMADPVQVP